MMKILSLLIKTIDKLKVENANKKERYVLFIQQEVKEVEELNYLLDLLKFSLMKSRNKHQFLQIPILGLSKSKSIYLFLFLSLSFFNFN